MRRITVLSVAGAATVAVAITSFMLSRTLGRPGAHCDGHVGTVANPQLINGTLSSR